LQLTRDPTYSRGFLSARSVTGFLSDVYPAAADEIGKIHLIADERVYSARCSEHIHWILFFLMHSILHNTLNIMCLYQVQGAVFDLPEEIAKELLNKQLPPGNTIEKITKVLFRFWSLIIDGCT